MKAATGSAGVRRLLPAMIWSSASMARVAAFRKAATVERRASFPLDGEGGDATCGGTRGRLRDKGVARCQRQCDRRVTKAIADSRPDWRTKRNRPLRDGRTSPAGRRGASGAPRVHCCIALDAVAAERHDLVAGVV